MSLLGLPLTQLLGVFGALGAAVTVLYILRLRRRRVHVPFAKLWERVLREKESTSLFRRLKRILSLLLQLAFLALLTAALGDPRLTTEIQGGRTIVLLLDTSASMKATDGDQGTRLETALGKAREIVRGLSGADSLMVVRMDAQVTPQGPFATDEKALLKTLETVEASDTRADLARALKFCADALRDRKNPLLILVGDGAYPRSVLDRVRLDDPDGKAAPKVMPQAESTAQGKRAGRGDGSSPALDEIDLRGVTLRYAPVGRSGDNVGIVAFNARRYARNKLSFEVFLEVVNSGETAREVDLQLLADGQVTDVLRLQLRPKEKMRYTCDAGDKEQKGKAWCQLGSGGEILEARITAPAPSGGEPPRLDIFPLDDRAFAVLPKPRKQRVLLVSKGNLFLEGALLLDENLDLTKVAPGGYSAATAERFDAIVFDGFFPPIAPRRHTLIMNPPSEGGAFRVAGRLTAPLVTEQDTRHPVMRWVTLKDVNIGASAKFVREPGLQVLAASFRDALLVAREDRGVRSVALGFDITRSDLPLRVAFPLLIINSLDWFSGDGESLVASYRTGENWAVPLGLQGEPTGRSEVRIMDPDGKDFAAAVHEGRALFYGSRIGVYTIQAGTKDGRRAVAANLADAEESDIRPSSSLAVAGRTLEAPTGFGVALRREIWIYLLLAALGLSLTEWLTYNRRVTV
jgi:hypothetical protein